MVIASIEDFSTSSAQSKILIIRKKLDKLVHGQQVFKEVMASSRHRDKRVDKKDRYDSFKQKKKIDMMMKIMKNFIGRS